jgi:hypothetical protein
MALLFWDASALAKRYTLEMGQETVDAVFANAAAHEMATSDSTIFASVYLMRQHNLNSTDAAILTMLLGSCRRSRLTALSALSSPPTDASCARPRPKGCERWTPKL